MDVVHLHLLAILNMQHKLLVLKSVSHTKPYMTYRHFTSNVRSKEPNLKIQ
jgi:hypothetical protein